VGRIKTLCLAFDNVLIPPEHLVVTPLGRELGENREVRDLMDARAIITSYWQTARDHVDFLDQLEEYHAEIGCPLSCPESAKATFAILPSYVRDVTSQSEWLGEQLVNALSINKTTIVSQYDERAFERCLDIVKGSGYRDIIPCSHERLLRLLAEDEFVPEGLKRDILQLSCLYYYEAGAIGNTCLRYPVVEIELQSLTDLKFAHVYAAFFAPEFIGVLLRALGMPTRLARGVGDLHSRDVLVLRESPASAAFWDTYYATMVEVSCLIDQELDARTALELLSAHDLDRTRQVMRDSLLGHSPSDDVVSFLLEFVGLMSGVPFVGLLARKLELKERVEELVLKFRHPGCVQYRDELRRRLEKPLQRAA
jgi:hypothetical protein